MNSTFSRKFCSSLISDFDYLSKFLTFYAVSVAQNQDLMPLICIRHVPLYKSTLALFKPFILSLISTGQVF